MSPYLDRLVQVRSSYLESVPMTQHSELGLVPPGSNSNDQAAAAKVIEGRQLLCEDDSIALGNHDHRYAKRDRIYLASDVCQRHQRFKDRLIWTSSFLGENHVIRSPGGGEPELLSCLGDFNHSIDSSTRWISR